MNCVDQRQMMLVMTIMMTVMTPVMSLNRGRAGVWDSPLATDQYVQQFGFLFGGGRSGVRGIQALQVIHRY